MLEPSSGELGLSRDRVLAGVGDKKVVIQLVCPITTAGTLLKSLLNTCVAKTVFVNKDTSVHNVRISTILVFVIFLKHILKQKASHKSH